MPIVFPYRSIMDMPPLPPETPALAIGAPILACAGVGGLWFISIALPPLILLTHPPQDSPALELLKAYQAGYCFGSITSFFAPLLYAGFLLLISWLMTRHLDPKARKELRWIPFVLPTCMIWVFPGLMFWSAVSPGGSCDRYDRVTADIQQIEAGQTEHITGFIHANSAPDTIFKDNPEGWQVIQRTVFSQDAGRRAVTLRFPEAVESALDPEGFAADSWDSVQWYEVYYTSGFHLVEQITPVP